MANTLLMPKATAVWLVDNTALSFEQIGHLCSLHPLEVQAIADGDVAQGIKGLDPVISGQLTREEIKKGESDKNYTLKLSESKTHIPEPKRGARYTPLSRRHDRPNAIFWLLRNYPDLKNAAISRLVGTTKSTIEQIRERKHWNIGNLTPTDPVTLGLCSQKDLDQEISKLETKKENDVSESDEKLLPASFTQNLSQKNLSDSQNEDTKTRFSKLDNFLKTENNL